MVCPTSAISARSASGRRKRRRRRRRRPRRRRPRRRKRPSRRSPRPRCPRRGPPSAGASSSTGERSWTRRSPPAARPRRELRCPAVPLPGLAEEVRNLRRTRALLPLGGAQIRVEGPKDLRPERQAPRERQGSPVARQGANAAGRLARPSWRPSRLPRRPTAPRHLEREGLRTAVPRRRTHLGTLLRPRGARSSKRVLCHSRGPGGSRRQQPPPLRRPPCRRRPSRRRRQPRRHPRSCPWPRKLPPRRSCSPGCPRRRARGAGSRAAWQRAAWQRHVPGRSLCAGRARRRRWGRAARPTRRRATPRITSRNSSVPS
mmetsp:Transcript_40191/g.125261  ORF Transcript_40191/g.125261 Transcript_40191/m.125261 type:complete len:316 (-) Transcript_40191:289-1236(-)